MTIFELTSQNTPVIFICGHVLGFTHIKKMRKFRFFLYFFTCTKMPFKLTSFIIISMSSNVKRINVVEIYFFIETYNKKSLLNIVLFW